MEMITLPVGGIQKLANDFKVSRKYVGMVLRGKSTSNLARMLRKAALERGGKIYRCDELMHDGPIPADFIAKCETTHDHGRGVVIQEFGSAARITIGGSRATVEIAGCDPVAIDGITTANWRQLQYGIQQILNTNH